MIERIRECIEKVASFLRREKLDKDLRSEMAAHLELAVEGNLMVGMTPEEARRRALIDFGGAQQALEGHREFRGIPLLDQVWQDLRYTFRTLRKDRAFTAITILILALGIGANIVVFSVVNTILLRPLPFHESQELVWFTGNHGGGGLSAVTYNVGSFEEFRKHNQSFEEVTSYQAFWGSSLYNMTGRGEPQVVQAVMVADNFFQTLEVQPAVGRTFRASECVKGAAPVVLLSQAFWQQHFGGDRAVVGQTINLNNYAATIVGVTPASFDFPMVFSPGLHADVFIPAYMDELRNWGNTLAIFGRLKPGISAAQAQAEANIVLPQLKAAHGEWFMAYSADITSLKDYVSGKLRRSLIVLWCAVAVILLIVCVNQANLLLARMASRSKEFAMRSALGASRGRLIRQFLTESLVLSGAGAIAGMALALGVTTYLTHQDSIVLPLLSNVRVDSAVLGWTLLITLIGGLLFGLVPGLALSGSNVQEGLKDSGRGISDGRKHDRLRAVMVVSEVSLACVLLVGAGLLLRSFLRVLDVDLGFQPSQAAALTIHYADVEDGAKRGAILQEILREVKALPGIEAAGITDMLPLDRNRSWGLSNPEREYRKDDDQSAIVRIVTPGYLEAIGIRLVEGRDFSWQDASSKQEVVIINETGARRNWPGQSPIGHLARGMSKEGARVVGVVSDVRVSSLESSPGAEIYLLATSDSPEGAELVVRSKLPPEMLTSAVINTLRKLDPSQPATVFRAVQSLVDHSVSPRRFFVLLVAIFAALGLLLAALGIYGVISYSVTRQTQEIGIRMALGALPSTVQLSVLSRTFRLALLGVTIGGTASFAVSKMIAALLFRTDPSDPPTFLGAVLLLLAVALVAGFHPALRATRVDPMIALRSE